MEHAFVSRETRHIHLHLPPQLGVGDTRKGNGYGARASQHPGPTARSTLYSYDAGQHQMHRHTSLPGAAGCSATVTCHTASRPILLYVSNAGRDPLSRF